MAKLFPDAPPIGFLQWMMVGVPVDAVAAAAYLVLPGAIRVAAVEAQRRARSQRHRAYSARALGPMSIAERRVMLVFAGDRRAVDAAVADSRRRVLLPRLVGAAPAAAFRGRLDRRGRHGPAAVPGSVGSQAPASACSTGRPPSRLPWGVLVLLGGGFALADATRATGLADWIGTRTRIDPRREPAS